MHFVTVVFKIKEYEKLETPEERLAKAREIYDHHIMVEMLAHSHVSRFLYAFSHFLALLKRQSPACSAEFDEKRCAGGFVSGENFNRKLINNFVNFMVSAREKTNLAKWRRRRLHCTKTEC